MANPNGNPENFEKTKGRLNTIPTREKQQIASLGGKASQKVQKQKKTMQELAQMIANGKPSKKVQQQLKKTFPNIEDDSLNNSVLLLSKVFQKAVMEMDIKAFEVFRDTAGQKPIDKKEFTGKDGEPLHPKIIKDDIK